MIGFLATTALKVLMIGNSFSISNTRNMPQICDSMGLELELGSLYIGGCPLQKHWQNIQKAGDGFAPYRYDLFRSGEKVKDAPKQWNIPEALKSQSWDIVTIQQVSGLSWRPESYSPDGDNVIKTIRELCPKAEIVVQQTWSYTPWDKRLDKWGIDQNRMFELLRGAYAGFAAKHSLRVIPMGEAVQLWRKKLPVKYTEHHGTEFGGDVVGNLGFVKKKGKLKPKVDAFHLNGKGEYLQSLVWTAFLFDVDVRKCKFIRPKTIGAETCSRLMETAYEVCRKTGP